MLAFTQPGSATVIQPGPSLDDLFNLPVTPPSGAANPFTWPWIAATSSGAPTPQPAGGVTAWLQGNATAVVVVAAALFALALFGGRKH